MMTETFTAPSGTWTLTVPRARVLVSGYQSWSEAELRSLTDVQARPTLDVLVRQGHDVAWPPGDRGKPGVWRSHTLIALIAEDGSGYVGCAGNAAHSFTHWEAHADGDLVHLSYKCEGDPEPAHLAFSENVIDLIESLSADLGREMQARTPAPLRVWCSWYSYYRDITFDTFVREATLARELDLPFDVFQLDDGFQADLGDWLDAKPAFGRHAREAPLVLRDLGFRAGLWLAPFIARPTSRLFREHPGWFLRDEAGELVNCGDNWGGAYYGLDTTLPEVQDWLEDLARTVVSWGYDYLKLDFLFAGAMPSRRHQDVSRAAAYRMGLEALRRGAGESTFILGCGAPLASSIGLVDAMRTGPDVAPIWDDYARRLWLGDATGPAARNAVVTSLSRWYQHAWYQPDPDVMIARRERSLLDDAERGSLLGLLDTIGGLRASSDPLRTLRSEDLSLLRRSLEVSAPDRPESLTSSWGNAPTRFTRGEFNVLDEHRGGLDPRSFRSKNR
ncbi:glycoside hydrolase family 36 protein [Deinococcus yavapaiensis]|uniref:Alpha-galactosidase n=1 Tax=Deinococcus yavapaiensis KR-236 TaxID=694435 RepID=A0A318S8M6_9DEIO|nr:glycoside hydrolase family 36 protein [Deinococcus yavapaiensis]PYE54465.1 alpha-galactosidase [Deinococcus yavapaiensis KR-236]